MTEFLDSTNKNRALLVIAAIFCLTIIPRDANCGVVYNDDADEVNEKIQFHLYTNDNADKSYILIPENHQNFAKSNFRTMYTTILFVHGFTGSYDTDSAQAIKNAYLQNGKYNVILVCWQKLAAWPWYNKAVKNTARVGLRISQMIKWLQYKKAIVLDNLHLIGFSLGAHVVAFAGEELSRTQIEKIGRITGMDPAGPAWDKWSVLTNGLDKTDAKIVDVIHTNTRFLGIELPVGHVDFYVNKGKSQPGCNFFSVGCSHDRSWQYYIETLKEPFGFPSDKCKIWRPEIDQCSPNSKIYMGAALDMEKAEGIYFVKTNKEKPYHKKNISHTKMEIKLMPSTLNSSTNNVDTEIYSIHDSTIPTAPYYIDELIKRAEENTTIILREGDDVYYPSDTTL